MQTLAKSEARSLLEIFPAKEDKNQMCIRDSGTAERFGGLCNLRMDDTNPTKEDVEFVDAIKEDIHWLGFDWGARFFYGSDYFEKDYEFAAVSYTHLDVYKRQEYTTLGNLGESYSLLMRLLPPSYRMFQPPAVL